MLTVEPGEAWGSADAGIQEQGCLFSGLACEHAGAVFPRGALPGPPEHQVILAGGQGPCSRQSADTCSPHPPLAGSSIKALLGQQLPERSSGWSERLDAPSCCVAMTTEGGGKLSPWLQLCSCVGTQGREVQCVPVSGPQAAEAVGTGRAAVPVGNSSARESAVCAHTRARVCVCVCVFGGSEKGCPDCWSVLFL